MSRKVILFVDHAKALGGAEKSLLLLLKYLDPNQWQCHLATTGDPLMAKASELGIVCHQKELPRLKRKINSPRLWLRQARELTRLAQEIKADLMVANTVRAAMYTRLAARFARRPFIWHMRDFWLSEEKPKRVWLDTAVKHLICTGATRVITNSQAVANLMPCAAKTTAVYNGIDLSPFDPQWEGASFRAENNIPDSVSLIGMIGRLRPWKGQTTFLHMAARIKQTWPDCHFVIVGGTTFGIQDDYRQQLRQLTQELQLTNCVTFTGALADVRPALAAMDVFVHPGQPEPFGLVNVEAMAMAKPVVAYNHGALPEIVVDGDTGWLIEPGNVSALAEAVSSLLANPDLGRQFGQNGRIRVQNSFTIQQTVAKINQILGQVLDKK